MKVLYLSYDGMTDNLGQSQVIPYLAGLSGKGCSITLVSFEKAEKFKTGQNKSSDLLKTSGITWKPLIYTKRPPILSTIWDVFRLKRLTSKIVQKEKFEIVHCRGYITSLAGIYIEKKFGLKFIFDMRAFYADERVDGKLWNTGKWIYRKVYQYFKRKEK